MSNKLKHETSPYLLQHAHNPVYWYPWCEEAFCKAREENKPIFLSIGYSTCHWCHVMAHESFEDEKIARVLNNHFIAVKVDREERPDIDSVYMNVCQTLTGGGGWPMSIFMTWDKKPFYAGTYFPPYSKYGMPGFIDLLNAVAEKWNNEREELLTSAQGVVDFMKKDNAPEQNIGGASVLKAVDRFEVLFDKKNGGFGKAPKFPAPHNLMFLILFSKIYNKQNVYKMAEKTLIQMRKGGIFDHIGYGFSRYSTDDIFLAPHFEKMLYDNALLIMAYSVAFAVSDNKRFSETAEKTAQYILREMTSPFGCFFSAQDADSEGVEGKYYTFSKAEILQVLGKEKGELFSQAFDITDKGNFEGKNIPNTLKSNDLQSDFNEEIKMLYGYRKNRHRLHLDDKILTSWNSLMISALCMLFRITHNEMYLKKAQKAQRFIEENLIDGVEIYTSFRNGMHSKQGFLDDYAFYVSSLIELYSSTLDTQYLDKAELFCKEALCRFEDTENGGFFLCKRDSTELFVNPKEAYDGAIPSGNSVMAYNLVRLYQITEKDEYKDLAEKQIKFMETQTSGYTTGNSMFLLAKLIYENPPCHITVVLKNKADLESAKNQLPFLCNVTIINETENYRLLNGKTTYYVCKNHTCEAPANNI